MQEALEKMPDAYWLSSSKSFVCLLSSRPSAPGWRLQTRRETLFDSWQLRVSHIEIAAWFTTHEKEGRRRDNRCEEREAEVDVAGQTTTPTWTHGLCKHPIYIKYTMRQVPWCTAWQIGPHTHALVFGVRARAFVVWASFGSSRLVRRERPRELACPAAKRKAPKVVLAAQK